MSTKKNLKVYSALYIISDVKNIFMHSIKQVNSNTLLNAYGNIGMHMYTRVMIEDKGPRAYSPWDNLLNMYQNLN